MSELDNQSDFKRRGDLKPYSFARRYDKQKAIKRARSGSNSAYADYSKDEKQGVIIVDSGAYTVKVGYSTKKEPTIIPNCIMKAKSERKRLFIGNQISECRDCSGLYYLLPCERGYITKWDVQKPIWDYTFNKNSYHLNDTSLIITQPLFNFKSIQDCMDELFFEEYEVNSMLRLNPTDMARLKYIEDHKLNDGTPLVIVDTGFSFTHVIPYINGNKYLDGIKRLNVGGKLLTNHLKDIISYRQYNVMEETYVINQVKEDTCYVAEDAKAELKLAAKQGKDNNIVKNYVLPDYNNIRRGYIQDPNKIDEGAENCQILRLNNERFLVPEIMFHPSDIGMKSMGISEAIVKSINLCPKEYQKSLASHIVVIGGTSKFPGFKKRLFTELRSLLPYTWTLNVYIPDDPITYTWSGGSSLLRYPNIKNLMVTKKEYDELGSTGIQKKYNYWNNSIEASDVDDTEINSYSYSILDNIKGKAIFGKQENGIVDLTVSKAPAEDKKSDSGETSNVDEVNDVTDREDDISPNSTPPVKKVRLKHKKNKEIAATVLPQEENPFEDVELFPFGVNSYI